MAVLLIAEIGINHNGDMDLAATMIRAAAAAGADAVKFQNYKTEDFLSDHTLKHRYKNKGVEIEESQFAMFKRCELADDQLRRLKTCCDQCGVLFFSTPTSIAGVDILRELQAPCLKNGSDYLGHLPLIRHMARSGIPTILSTGMATENEMEEAVNAFREAGGADLTLLVCTSAYPTPPDCVHLRRIPALAARFGVPAGFSDHTAGWEAAVAAVCLGATMIEKHFTTDRDLPGPDHWFSSTPEEFAELARRAREAEVLLGSASLAPTAAEEQARKEYRLSCVAARDLPAGHTLTENDIAFRRPASGILPANAGLLIGRPLTRAVKRGEVFQTQHITAAP